MRYLVDYEINGNIGRLRRNLHFYSRYYLNLCNQCINFTKEKYIFLCHL